MSDRVLQGHSSSVILEILQAYGRDNPWFIKSHLPHFRQALKLSGDWSKLAERHEKSGRSIRYIQQTLKDLSYQTGELMLIKLHEEGYQLLAFRDGVWRLVTLSGACGPEWLASAQGAQAEALIARLPSDPVAPSLSGLAGLLSALKSAWVEIGIASLLINGGLLLLPLFSMLVYDKVVSNGVFETLWALTLGMLLYLLTDTVMRLVRAWSMERVAEQLSIKSDTQLWHQVTQQKESSMGFSKLLTHYRDLSISREFVSSNYLLAIVDMPFLVLYLLAIAVIAWPLAVTTLVLVLLYSGLSFWIQHGVTQQSKETEQLNTQKLTLLSEVLACLDVVRTTPERRRMMQQWIALSETTATAEAKRRFVSGFVTIAASSTMTFTTVTLLVVGAYLIEAHLLTVGGLIACNLLASRAMSLVSSLYMVLGKWQDLKRAANKLNAQLGEPSSADTVARPSVRGELVVVNATKAYEGQAPSLQQVSLTIKVGERVALLGKPGAGKTTLLRALAGLAKLTQGQILVDGLDISQIHADDRASWLAWKPQEPVLFAGTLEENILMAGANPTDTRFQQALWVSGLEEEFKTGKLSLGMKLEERGANLSGGQRQKVAIARTLAQSAKIILLDEPSLGFDPDTERQFAERLAHWISPETTLIMTTHSATMLSLVKRVIALDQGKVIADGPKEKLLQAA